MQKSNIVSFFKMPFVFGYIFIKHPKNWDPASLFQRCSLWAGWATGPSSLTKGQHIPPTLSASGEKAKYPRVLSLDLL